MADILRSLINEKSSAAVKSTNDTEGGVAVKQIKKKFNTFYQVAF